jgi:hypothetical protein
VGGSLGLFLRPSTPIVLRRLPEQVGLAMDTNRMLMIAAAVIIVALLVWYFYPTMPTTPTPPAK